MTSPDFRPREGESEFQFLWRIGEAKTNGLIDADWEEIGEIMNRYFRADESEYRTPSAYRKPYQYAKMIFSDVFAEKPTMASPGGMNEMLEAKAELEKERVRLRDERVQYNKYIRDAARYERRLEEIERALIEYGEKRYAMDDGIYTTMISSAPHKHHEMLVLLGDWHIGMCFSNEFGSYNVDIAKERLKKLLAKIDEIWALYPFDACNVVLLGDNISGGIHMSLQVANQENTIQQVMTASTLMADFLASLCVRFPRINFTSVAGNHSRLLPERNEALKGERLDDLVAWYASKMLSRFPNFHVIEQMDNTLTEMEICGKQFLFAHGDNDDLTQAGVLKLSAMMGALPYAICIGHYHYPKMDEICGVKLIQNGTLMGTGDDYTVQKRLSGKASQTLVVCTEDGIESCYPVRLE